MTTKLTNPKDAVAVDKLDLSLFPQTALAYGALGFTEGDLKYGGYNFREAGVLCSVYIAALCRHISKFYNGEWADKKTQVPHLASALACVAIVIDAHECGVLRDDRPPKVDMDRVIDELQGIAKHLKQIFPDGPSRVTANTCKTVPAVKESNEVPWPKRVILDFDGVVHQATTPFTSSEVIPDGPVPGAFEAIVSYLRAGYKVSIYSGRSALSQARRAMKQWFYDRGMAPSVIENLEFSEQKPNGELYIDDRGFHFTGGFPSVEFVKGFQPWNKAPRLPIEECA